MILEEDNVSTYNFPINNINNNIYFFSFLLKLIENQQGSIWVLESILKNTLYQNDSMFSMIA